jgi:hypothetical protein
MEAGRMKERQGAQAERNQTISRCDRVKEKGIIIMYEGQQLYGDSVQ